jgi:enoyl-CoA hydratase/carnithine racemase
MKDTLNRALDADLATCLDLEAERMVEGARTLDYEEAVRALREGRAPVFRGR